jgi:hypothetical protein
MAALAKARQVGVTYADALQDRARHSGSVQPGADPAPLADALDVDLDRISTREPIDRAA